MTATRSNTGSSGGGRGSGKRQARSAARLFAVQALYQMRQNGMVAPLVIDEFVQHRLGKDVDGEQYADADPDLFADIVRGVGGRSREIDDLIGQALDKNRELDRLEQIMQAILRAGTYEMMVRIDVPVKVIINEYVDVAHAFFSNAEGNFVNGVLDKLGHRLRAAEIAP